MHIEHKQFLDLVAEASGMDLEKAEKQLTQLVGEIKQSLSDGEAYEIEGFGIFSSLGNRIMFIPSGELETEINFKYVGMEPIELDEPALVAEEEDPFEGLDDITSSEDSLDSRFAGLIDEEDIAKLTSEEDTLETEERSTDDLLDDIFADNDITDEDLGDDLILESSDDIEESIEEETDEIELDEAQKAAPILELDTSTEPEMELDLADEDILEEGSIEEEEDPIEELDTDEEDAIPEMAEAEDFDDPFYSIEDEQFDESVLRMEDLDETEIVPVIKNITTDVPDESPAVEKEKSKKELQKEEKERKKQELKEEKERKKQEKKEAKEKAKAAKKSKSSEPAPAWLWVILILVVVGGGVVGLGYFSIINIPFITPQTASNTVTSQPVQQQATQTQQPVQATEQPATDPVANENDNTAAVEQATEPVVEEVVPEISNTLPVEGQYGLTGQVSAAGNDGFTIILYTLSNQTNAVNEAQKLIDAGFRGFLTPVESERYGTLYRVSLGQFGSLFDAAVASEEIENILPENFIIKKIN
jgi:hypothetical protein